MAIKFLDKLKNIPTAFQNAMLGTPVQGLQPEASINNAYPQSINDFVSDMKTQQWAQPLFNKQTGYTDNQLVERIGNGLNDGYKQIADFQAQNNIRIPKTGEEIDLASIGQFNQYPQIQTGISNEPRQGGFLRDMAAGARENYNEGFNLNNWGQKKNAATRIGEFLGSVARFADSAPGRGLIAGGLIGALGGNPTEMAAYGLSAGVGRQQNRMADQVYRKDLINSLQNSLRNSAEFNDLSDDEKQQILNSLSADPKYATYDENTQNKMFLEAYNQALREKQNNMLSDIENQVNNYRGMFTPDMYKNILSAQTMRDNAAYRNAYLQLSAENNRLTQQLRQDQLESQKAEREFNKQFKLAEFNEKKAENAYKRAIEGKRLSLEDQKLALEYQKFLNPKETAADRKERAKLQQSQNTINMINKARETVRNNPKAFGFVQGALGADVSNRLYPGGTKARSVINSVAAEYRKYLTGAQMSDRERKDYEKFLPAPKDNAQIIENKLNAMVDVISAREGLDNVNITPTTQTKKIGKYTVEY